MSLLGNSQQWYAVHTRSNFETRVAGQLESKGLENYLPAYEESHQWKDRRKKVRVPLFAGYVFARFSDTAEERVRVLATPGVAQPSSEARTSELHPVLASTRFSLNGVSRTRA